MRKKILELGPVVLSYCCVLVAIIGIIKDFVIGDTSGMTLPMHILLCVLWSIVAVKWTIQYREKKKEEQEEC